MEAADVENLEEKLKDPVREIIHRLRLVQRLPSLGECETRSFDDEVQEHLRMIMQQEKEVRLMQTPSYVTIPQFYFKKPAPIVPGKDPSLFQLIHSVARMHVLDARDQALISAEDIDAMFTVLKEHASMPTDKLRINYLDFCSAAEKSPPGAKSVLTAEVFLGLEQDSHNRVSIFSLINYILKMVFLEEMRIELSMFDLIGSGFLMERDLENFFYDLLEKIPQLQQLDDSFHFVYVFTAVRRIFFFLDPLRRGKVSISALLKSPMIFDLFELREANQSSAMMDSNWFSARSALRVYQQYLGLDKDRNGLLNKEEFSRYGELTDVFLDRIFQECNSYSGEIDYRTYLEIVLMFENKRTSQSLQSFFRLLDIDKTGVLTPFTVSYFFKPVVTRLVSAGFEAIKCEDVVNEIFDMVKPKEEMRITLEDLIRSNAGDTVVTILSDVAGFREFENIA